MIRIKHYSAFTQYLVAIGSVLLTAALLFLFGGIIGYRTVALILLLIVSMLAILCDIFPVLVAAVLSALIWNFFFIPPIMTFHVGTPEDALMFLMYFVIALINAVFTFKIRVSEARAREKEDRQKAVKLYNTLLNSLSHELRTPIATILGSVDTILSNESKLTPDNRVALYKEIEKAGIRLNQQVENLLSMSRVEAGMLRPNPDWCDVNEMVHKLLANYRDRKAPDRILFEADEKLPFFMLDRVLIEQILHNIIDNAIRHTPADASLSVSVSHHPGVCRFIISDSGPGFADHELALVFDRFYRLPGAKPGGIGLGLSIAKGFAEVLQGKIHVRNRPEGGAEFTLDIPAATAHADDVPDE